MQILRIQSATGTKRLEIVETACLRDLFESVHSLFDLDNFEFTLFKERNNKDEVTQHKLPQTTITHRHIDLTACPLAIFQLTSSRSQHLADVGLKHGDMIFLQQAGAPVASTSAAGLAVAGPSTTTPLQQKPSSSSLSTVSSSSSINSMAGVAGSSSTPASANINKKVYDYHEDEVDQALYKIDGRIQRQRDPKL